MPDFPCANCLRRADIISKYEIMPPSNFVEFDRIFSKIPNCFWKEIRPKNNYTNLTKGDIIDFKKPVLFEMEILPDPIPDNIIPHRMVDDVKKIVDAFIYKKQMKDYLKTEVRMLCEYIGERGKYFDYNLIEVEVIDCSRIGGKIIYETGDIIVIPRDLLYPTARRIPVVLLYSEVLKELIDRDISYTAYYREKMEEEVKRYREEKNTYKRLIECKKKIYNFIKKLV